jgi:hypothetical protein
VFPAVSSLIGLLGSDNIGLVLVAVGGSLGGLYLFYRGFQMLRFKRMILDTPLSRIHSASIGLVEVTGTPVGPYVLTAPVTGDPCYYYRVQAWQWVESDNKHAWKAVLDESLFVPFFLEDSTGRVLVNPQGADMDVHRNFSDEISAMIFQTLGLCPPNVRNFLAMRGLIPTEKIKLEERVIPRGFPLFAFGTLGENPARNSWSAQPHAHSSPSGSLSVSSGPLISFAFPQKLSAQTTSSVVGILNRVLGVQVSSSAVALPGLLKPSSEKSAFGEFDLHPSAAISKGERNEPFAISWHSQKEVAGKLAWKSAACIWGGAIVAIICIYFLVSYFPAL